MILLAALLAAGATLLALPRGPQARVRSLLPGGRRGPRNGPRARDLSRAAGACAAVGTAVLVGGLPGVACAVVVFLVLPRLLGRLQPRAERDRQARLVAQAPLVADLLGASLAAGAPLRAALGAVCRSVDEPARATLAPVLAALDLGADPAVAWQHLRDHPALGAIASAVVRSSTSGAPLAGVLARIADDLRREHRAAVEVAARAAGVRSVLPLAACFLPAFLLLGVVPVVAALAGGLLA